MKGGSLLLVASILSRVTTASERPNIVFILADDLGWDDVSFHGSDQIPTPALDVLAYDGVILNNYYVQRICTPSRAALLTGRHPIHLGLQTGVIMGSEPYALSLKETLLPQYLKKLGYQTHMVGKWHVGYMAQEYTPTYRGFDSHFGYYGGCDDYWDHTYRQSAEPGHSGLDFWENGIPYRTAFGQYSTHAYTERAQRIIEEHDQTKPLFLYLPHQAPHNGNGPTMDDSQQAPYKYIQRFNYIGNKHRRKFAAMVSVLDESIHNLTKSLYKKGILNNTIIAFSTDNGGPAAGYSLNMACNQPLRGMKYTLWEGGIRGNGFLWSPLLKNSQYVSNHMMQVFDWLPTLLHPAGYDLSALPADLDAVDLWEALSEKHARSPRTEMLHNIDPREDNFALRKDDMKIKSGGDAWGGDWYPQPTAEEGGFQNIGPDPDKSYFMTKMEAERTTTSMQRILRSIGRVAASHSAPVVVECGSRPADYKTNCQPTLAPCLYNITADPCEYNNLADSRPALLLHLLARVRAHNATVVPPLNKPLDPRGLPLYHNGIWAPWLNISQALDIERRLHPDYDWARFS